MLALRAELFADGGWSCDLSPPVLMRAMCAHRPRLLHSDVAITGLIGKTHLASNTAFRGFGGPQGMLVGEEIVDRVARHLGLPAHEVRQRNFYRAGETPDRNVTPYHQPVVDNHLDALWDQLLRDSDFSARRVAVDAFNAVHPHRKRGLAVTPVKFGISFNTTSTTRRRWCTSISTAASVEHGGHRDGPGPAHQDARVAARVLACRRRASS